MDNWSELMSDTQRCVEAVGRALKPHKVPLTHEELTHLRDSLNRSAETIQTVRDNTTLKD